MNTQFGASKYKYNLNVEFVGGHGLTTILGTSQAVKLLPYMKNYKDG